MHAVPVRGCGCGGVRCGPAIRCGLYNVNGETALTLRHCNNNVGLLQYTLHEGPTVYSPQAHISGSDGTRRLLTVAERPVTYRSSGNDATITFVQP